MTVKVVDGNNNPINGATVILNSVPYGSTGVLNGVGGILQIPSLDEGSYDVEAQKPLGSAPPQVTRPTPTPMSATEIVALPSCSDAPHTGLVYPCSVSGSNPSCPGIDDTPSSPNSQWGSECVVIAGQAGSTCACFPPQALTASCDLAIAGRPATVPASGNVTVVLTLCTNCQNGVPQSCTQHCESTADCDNNNVCISGGDCGAPPRIVTIKTEPGAFFLVQNDNFFSPDQAVYPVDFQMTCDPYQTPTGGVATETICDAYSPGDTGMQAVFTVTCHEDQPSGEIEGNLRLTLAENCGSGGSIQDDKSIDYSLFTGNPSSSVTERFSFQACFMSALEFTVDDGLNNTACVANNIQGDLDITSSPVH